MPTYSTRLGIKLIGTGEESNSWGATTNSTFENTFEQAITSVYSKALGAASSPLTLTSNLQGPVQAITKFDEGITNSNPPRISENSKYGTIIRDIIDSSKKKQDRDGDRPLKPFRSKESM